MKKFGKILILGTFILLILLAVDASADCKKKKTNVQDLQALGEILKPKPVESTLK